MEYYRLLQYLSRGQNIKHINKHYILVPEKQRFDNKIFDLLALHEQEQSLQGIILSDDDEETLACLDEKLAWLTKQQGTAHVITEQPGLYADSSVELTPYSYRKNKHCFTNNNKDNLLLLEAAVNLLPKTKTTTVAKTLLRVYKQLQ